MPREFITKWQRKKAITSDRLNEIRDQVTASLQGADGLAVSEIGRHRIIRNNKHPANPFAISLFRVRVKEIKDDHLVCKLFIPDAATGKQEDTPDIFVAKPFELRKTAFDTKTFTYPNGQNITYTFASSVQDERTADDGTDTETQIMTPQYFVDTEIIAIRGIDGSTGVTITVTDVVEPIRLEWEDINNAGRFWAKK